MRLDATFLYSYSTEDAFYIRCIGPNSLLTLKRENPFNKFYIVAAEYLRVIDVCQAVPEAIPETERCFYSV